MDNYTLTPECRKPSPDWLVSDEKLRAAVEQGNRNTEPAPDALTRIERKLWLGDRSHGNSAPLTIFSEDGGKTWFHEHGTPVHFLHLRDACVPCDVEAQTAVNYRHWIESAKAAGSDDVEERLRREGITPRSLTCAANYVTGMEPTP